MKKYILILLTGLSACTSPQQQSTQENTAVEVGLSDDFLEFYEKFHADSLFQLDHISWPLAGSPGVMDTTQTNTSEDFFWTRDQWKIHRPFNHDAQFKREFETLGESLVNEVSVHQQHQIKMVRRFANTSDGWKLIFYAAP